MRFVGACYRGHDPRWAFEPLSGDGARLHGGRFNPAGVPALYLSTSLHACILEATQGLEERLKPLTLVSYHVDVREIADLTDPQVRIQLDAPMTALGCPWIIERAAGRPASWAVVDRLRREHAGILVPSFAPGATPEHVNLVLWRWNDDPTRCVTVNDPEGRLPRDGASWA